jgi:hypothetical protein
MAGNMSDQELQEYLARIRKTIADSQALVSQTELRLAETDRMLESQGMTREQILSLHFSDEQMRAVNTELKRRGLDPVSADIAAARSAEPATSFTPAPVETDPGEEIANRRQKFGMMMKPFQI